VYGDSVLRHKKKESTKCKRVQVSFTEEQWKLIEKFKGVMGSDDAEVVRNIVLAWLAEKSVVAKIAKEKMNRGAPE